MYFVKGKLVKFSDQKWNEIALRINGEVEENGEANLSSALLWLDRYKPGLLAKAKDIYGNNMAMYTFAVMISRIKSMDECCAYEKALTMLKLLEKFGVDVCQANQFGISAQMVYGRDSESKMIVNPVLR